MIWKVRLGGAAVTAPVPSLWKEARRRGRGWLLHAARHWLDQATLDGRVVFVFASAFDGPRRFVFCLKIPERKTGPGAVP